MLLNTEVSLCQRGFKIIDNLDRSKQILESDESLKNTEALKKTLEHLDIIYKDLLSIFSKNNIEPIISLNKKLDPNLHQAMMEIEDDQKRSQHNNSGNTKGFTLKDRLLRPSLVGVSKKTGTKTEKNQENEEDSEKK